MEDYKVMMEDLLSHEEYCYSIAKQKSAAMDKNISKCFDSFKNSSEEIKETCRAVVKKMQQWEIIFLRDLEISANEQRVALTEEKFQLEKTVSDFSKFVLNIKNLLASTSSSSQQEVALLNLPKIVHLLQEVIKEEFQSYPVHFVDLKFLNNSTDIHKVGYLECEPIKISDFHLSSLENPECCHFMIWVPLEYKVEEVCQYFSWKIESKNPKVQIEGRVWDTNYQLKVAAEPGSYVLSFFIYNQHITGSPHFFQVKSKKITSEANELKSAFKPSDPRPVASSPVLERVKAPSPQAKALRFSLTEKNLLKLRPPKERVSNPPPCEDAPNHRTNHHTPTRNEKSRRSPLAHQPLRRPHPSSLQHELWKSLRSSEGALKAGIVTDCLEDVPATDAAAAVQRKQDVSGPCDSTFGRAGTPGATTLLNTFTEEDREVASGDGISSSPSSSSSSSSPSSIYPKEGAREDYFGREVSIEKDLKKSVVNSPDSTAWSLFGSGGGAMETSSPVKPRALFHNVGDKDRPEVPLRLWPKGTCELLFNGFNLNHPVGVLELNSREIVIADTFNDRLLLISSTGHFLMELRPRKTFTQPSAMALLPDGNFAIIDKKEIMLFSPDCEYVSSIGSQLLRRPYGLAYGNDYLITIDLNRDSVSVVCIDPASGVLKKRIPLRLPKGGQSGSMPRFIAFRPPNDLLIVDLGLDVVYVVDLDTGEIADSFGGRGNGDGAFRDPSGIACDAEGFVIVGDSKNHRLQVFDPIGNFVCVLKVDRPLQRPSGIFLNDRDELFLLNYWEPSLVKYKLTLG